MARRTRLSLTDGGMLYSEALRRSLKVWWRGLGTGFPLASLITLFVAYGHLTRNGFTTWDDEGAFAVRHERVGLGRIVAVILFFVAFAALVVAGSAG